MDSNDIINHIMITPANTNPNILRSQFDERDKPIWDNIGQLNNDITDINEQLDSTVEGSLANTVDGVVDEIGTDDTADTILGRITALENSSGGGGEWEKHNLFSEYNLYFSTVDPNTFGEYIVRNGFIVVSGYVNAIISSGSESGIISTPTLIEELTISPYVKILCRGYSTVGNKKYEWFTSPLYDRANIYYNFDSGTTGSQFIYFNAIYFFNKQR